MTRASLLWPGRTVLIVVLGACIVPAPALAAGETVEKLEGELALASGGERLPLLQRLAELLLEKDPERASRYAESMDALAKQLKDQRGQAGASFMLGEVDRVRDRYEEAGTHYGTARRLYASLGETRQLARSTRRLGDIYFFLRGWERALGLYLQALQLFEKVAAAEGTSSARLQVGHVYTAMGNVLRPTRDLPQALAYYQRALKVYEAEGFAAGLAGAYTSIGTVLQEQGKLDEALEVQGKAREVAERLHDLYALSIALNNTGSVYLERGDLEQARAFFEQSLQISESEERNRGIMGALLKLAELERRQGSPRKAMAALERAGALAEQLADPRTQAEVLAERSEVHTLLGDHVAALADYKQAEKLQNGLLDAAKARQLTEMRLAHETQSRDREIELLKREREVVLLERALLLAVVVAVGGLTVLLLGRYRLKTRTAEELARAYRRVEELSRTDELTALPNRRAIRERLGAEESQALRSGEPLSVVLGDIDGFKEINDVFGHGCGDAVLQAVASRLRGAIRGHDVVGRWGGEEFLFVLPATPSPEAAAVAERVRAEVAATPFACGDREMRMAMTFGICQLDATGLDACLRGADHAMYLGKAQGKDRVVVGKPIGDSVE